MVEDGRKILSSVVASQVEEHKIYGGVVPEIASRRHSEAIVAVVQEALERGRKKLSQVDASVGGKTGVDLPEVTNWQWSEAK